MNDSHELSVIPQQSWGEMIVIERGRKDNGFGVKRRLSSHGPVFRWVALCEVLNVFECLFILFNSLIHPFNKHGITLCCCVIVVKNMTFKERHFWVQVTNFETLNL